MADATQLLDALGQAGIRIYRDDNGRIRMGPSERVTEAFVTRVREVRQEIEALIPAPERWEDCVPIFEMRPCQNPRPHRSTYCRNDLGHGPKCGDCLIARAAAQTVARREAWRAKEATRLSRERSLARYIPVAASEEDQDEE